MGIEGGPAAHAGGTDRLTVNTINTVAGCKNAGSAGACAGAVHLNISTRISLHNAVNKSCGGGGGDQPIATKMPFAAIVLVSPVMTLRMFTDWAPLSSPKISSTTESVTMVIFGFC